MRLSPQWTGLILSITPFILLADVVKIGPSARPEIMSNNQVRDIMIKDTWARYGYCACPYSKDSLGGQCGTESRYYKPEADKVYCYRVDIPSEQVYFFRLKRIRQIELGASYSELDATEPVCSTNNPAAAYFTNNAENSVRPNGQAGAPVTAPLLSEPQPTPDPTADYFKNTGQNTARKIPDSPSTSYGSAFYPSYNNGYAYPNAANPTAPY